MKQRNRHNPFSLFSFQDIITGLCGILIFFVLIMLVDFVSRRENPQQAHVESIADDAISGDMGVLRREIDALAAELARTRAASQKIVATVGESASPEVAKEMKSEIDEKARILVVLASRVAALRARVMEIRNDEAKIRELERTRQTLEDRLAELKKSNLVTLIPERGVAKLPVYVVCDCNGAEVLRPLERGVARKRIAVGKIEKEVAEELKDLDCKLYAVVLLVRPSGAKFMDSLASKIRSLGFGCGRDPLEEDAKINIGSVKGDGQ